jgi:hypothetical protein
LCAPHNLRPDLAAEYAELETEIGHRFGNDVPMANIITAARQADIAVISGEHRTRCLKPAQRTIPAHHSAGLVPTDLSMQAWGT